MASPQVNPKTCAAKNAYTTRGEAQHFFRIIRKKHAGISIYKCQNCGLFHIGKKIKVKKKVT
jgi:hypothetical protein